MTAISTRRKAHPFAGNDHSRALLPQMLGMRDGSVTSMRRRTKLVVAAGGVVWAVAVGATEPQEIFVASDAGLSEDDLSKITSDVAGVSDVSLAYWERMVVERGESQLDVTVIADERNVPRAESSGNVVWPLVEGTPITSHDVANRADVLVIGGPVQETLLPGSDPVGEELLLGGKPFRVKGVLAPHPAFESAGPPDEAHAKRMLATRVYVPFSTGVATFFEGKPVSTLLVSVERPERLEEVASAIRRLLSAQHGDGLSVGVVPIP